MNAKTIDNVKQIKQIVPMNSEPPEMEIIPVTIDVINKIIAPIGKKLDKISNNFVLTTISVT